LKKLFQGCLGIIVLVVVVGVIIGAVSGGGSSSDDKKSANTSSTSDDSSSASTPTKSNKPKATKPKSSPKPKKKGVLSADAGALNKVVSGKAYQLGDFKIHKGWKVTKDPYLGYNVENLVVENTTDSDHTFSVEFKLHQGAHRIVSHITCLADQAQPQDIVDVDCFPDGKGAPYGYVTVENSL
jgi:hypothetical protein